MTERPIAERSEEAVPREADQDFGGGWATLMEREQTILLLHENAGLSFQKIAERLGVSKSRIVRIALRARKKLRSTDPKWGTGDGNAGAAREALNVLTEKEHQVLGMRASGASMSRISRSLDLSQPQIHRIIKSAREKLRIEESANPTATETLLGELEQAKAIAAARFDPPAQHELEIAKLYYEGTSLEAIQERFGISLPMIWGVLHAVVQGEALSANDTKPRRLSYRTNANGQREHQCIRCRRWLPATTDYFSAVGKQARLSVYCLQCRRKAPRVSRA